MNIANGLYYREEVEYHYGLIEGSYCKFSNTFSDVVNGELENLMTHTKEIVKKQFTLIIPEEMM